MSTYQIETREEVYDYFGDDYFEVAVLSEKVMNFLKENAVLVDSTEVENSEEASEEGSSTEETTTETEEEKTTTEEETTKQGSSTEK